MPFVWHSWLNSYAGYHHTARAREGGYLTAENRPLGARLKDRYYQEHTRVVKEFTSRGRTVIACSPDDDDVLCGFACGELHETGVRVVHYVYVKPPTRGLGIARALVQSVLEAYGDGEVVVSHVTKPGIMRKIAWHHVPYVAFLAKKERAA